jgi:ATP-binding cassette subfamily B multidrug efflux pump
MFRLFENLVDPYAPYAQDDRPPQRLWPFMRAWSRPFHRVFGVAIVLSIVVATIEVGLIARSFRGSTCWS